MSRFKTKTCYTCGEIELEDNMLEYNDLWFCCIQCKSKQERKENASLDTYLGRSNVVKFRES